MISPHVLGVACALISALGWGSGDFSGGVATRRHDQFQVLALMSLPGLAIMLLGALVVQEGLPGRQEILWTAAAGLLGAGGLAALYRGLSQGNTAVVAPTAAVIGTSVPIVFGGVALGLPGARHLAGFCLALCGIWCVSRSPAGPRTPARSGLLPAVLAGIGFGGFFVLIAQVEDGRIFMPLVVAKAVGLALALVVIGRRGLRLPRPGSSPVGLLAGIFDAGGNIFYMLARQYTRLDVAAVLSSMYPSVTVILACLILRERVAMIQWAGLALCLGAIGLFALP